MEDGARIPGPFLQVTIWARWGVNGMECGHPDFRAFLARDVRVPAQGDRAGALSPAAAPLGGEIDIA